MLGPTLPDYRTFVPRYYPEDWINLAGQIAVTYSVRCVPLIRQSLHLACSLDILFLRNEEPGSLVFQGGDLDNRIKTLFDALRMPNAQELEASEEPTSDPLYCVLESDTLISGFSVKTGRLLGARTKKPHAVRLWIDVSVEVLRVRQENMCLVTS